VKFSKISPINTLILYINVYAYAEHRLNSNGLHIYHPTKTSYVGVFFMSNDLRCEMVVRLVDIVVDIGHSR
jgi:hypothetical protein